MTELVNINHTNQYDVYIGRGSKWGNPFKIGNDGTRQQVVLKYSRYMENRLASGEVTEEELLSLEDKILGCHCVPQLCHGIIIIGMIKRIKSAKNIAAVQPINNIKELYHEEKSTI